MISMRRLARGEVAWKRTGASLGRWFCARVKTPICKRLHRPGGGVTDAPDATEGARCGGGAGGRCLRSPGWLLDSREHSWTHPEGWRDWPCEAPATTVTSR